ncbi:MAG: cohesin domain-containing protein [Bacteroidetes bacterium]|jgi:hypothetical protein|nr:cohesin domain-containing protein [Bacteroidota bacterium]
MNVTSIRERTRWLGALLLMMAVGAAAQPTLTIPDTTGKKNDTLLIPVVLSGLGANSLYALQATVDVGSTHATVVGVSTAGTLTAGASATYFGSTRRLAVALTTPVTGNGILLYLQTVLNGTPGQTSTLGLSSVMLNEGTPSATIDPGSVRLRNVVLSPRSLSNVAEGDSVQFVVTGDVVPPLTWSTSSSAVGMVDGTGKFIAGTPGFVTVFVTDGEGKRDSTNAFNVVPSVIKSLTLWIPDTSRTQTLEVAVPVRVTTLTGLGITSAQFRLTFNTSHLEYLGLDLAGGMMSAWGPPVVNDLTPGTLDFALAGSDTLAGAGSLFSVRFRVKQSAVGNSTLGLANATFNETITPSLDPGTFTVIPAPLIKVNTSRTAALKGETVTVPSVTGGTSPFAYSSSNPSIATVDPSTGTLTVLTRGPVLIQAVDAQGFPGKSDTIQTYDFTAKVRDTTMNVGDSVVVPVVVGATDGLGIMSLEFRLSLDTTKVSFRGIVLDGTLSNGWNVTSRDSAGKVNVAAAGTAPLNGSGTIVGIRLAASATLPTTDSTTVALSNIRFNEPGSSTPRALPVPGKLVLVVPNSAPVFTSILADTSIDAGSTMQFTFAAVDAESDPVHYSIIQGPPSAMIDSITGVLTLAALLTDVGSNTLQVRATDGSLSTTTTSVVTVTVPNPASFRFDGTQDRARVTDSAPLHPSAVPSAYQVTGTAITVESWVYLTGLPGPNSGMFIAARPGNNGIGVDPWHSYGLIVNNYDGSGVAKLSFMVAGATGGSGVYALDTDPVQTGQWYHVAGTYDGSQVRLYVNGVLKRQVATSVAIASGGTGFYIGGMTYDYMNGLIDDVRLWNVTRLGPDIAAAKDAALVGNESGLVGYWPLDSAYVSGANVVTPDRTSNHNDLAVQFDTKLVPFPAGSTVQFAPTNLSILPARTGGGYAVTQTEYRSKLVSDGWPVASINVTQKPATASLVGDSLIWTPGASEFGSFPVIATLTNGAGSITDTVNIFVEALYASSNLTTVDISHRGKIGAFGDFGKGVSYGGKKGLYAGDFSLVDRNSTKYAGGLTSAQNSFRPIEAFTPATSRFAGFAAVRNAFTDEWESSRIGVRVVQTAHVKPTSPDDRYTIIEYRIVNESGTAIDDLFAQMTADFDIGSSLANRGAYDSTLDLSYAYEEGGATNSNYYGFQLLGRSASGAAVFLNGTDAQFVRSTANLTTFPAVPATPGDTRNQITAGPFALAPSETVTVAFAYHAADNLTQLQQSAQAAKTRYTAAAPTFASVTDLAVPGAEYRRRVNRNGTPLASVSAISLPAGAVLSGDTLIWTPTDVQLGFRRVILQATNLAGSVLDTTDILVEAVRAAENQVRVDLTNRGKVGAFGLFGKGIWYKGKNGSGAADFSLVDRNSNKFAGGLYSTLFSFSPDGPPTSSVGFIDTTSRLPGFTAFRTSFNDQWEPSATRIGVKVRMLGYVKATAPDDRYVIVEYNVVNTSGAAVDDLFAQMTADFDVGNAGANLGGFDALRNLSYAYEQGGGTDATYYGVTLLSHAVAGHAVFVAGADAQYVRSTSNLTTLPAIPGVPGDTRNQLTAGPFTLAAGDTLRFGVAFLAADDLTQLQTAAQQAKTVWGNFTTSVAQLDLAVPSEFEVAQNYPNPFNPSTVIRFGLPTESRVSVTIYDQLGREVSTLVNGLLGAGMHEARWDASGMASGLYFFRIDAVGVDGARFARTNKMVLMK